MKKNNDKDRRYNIIIILTLLVSIIAISIGYAAYNSLLNIDTKVYLKGKDWLIKFDNLSTPTLTGAAKVIGEPIITNSNITLDVSFERANDSVVYTFDVLNSGSIDAKLSTEPIVTGIPTNELENVTYTITYNDGSKININDELNAGQRRKIKISILFTGKSLSEDIEGRELDISTTLLYVQK